MSNNVSDTIKYVGVNDHSIDLFEGQYHVPHGMCYNSYVIIDEKIAVMDTVDIRFGHEWLDHIYVTSFWKTPIGIFMVSADGEVLWTMCSISLIW